MLYYFFYSFIFFFFFNDTATTEIYTLSLHDALPISGSSGATRWGRTTAPRTESHARSEEHTSELQSPKDLVCRLLLEKKKTKYLYIMTKKCDGIKDEKGHVSKV